MMTASATFAEQTHGRVRRTILTIAILSVLSVGASSARAAGAPTATVLLSYPNPSLPGMTVTFTAVVLTFYNPSLPPPTGQVFFSTEYDLINPIFGGIWNIYQIPLGGSSLVSSTAQFNSVLPFSLPFPYDVFPSAAPPGNITACYSGDANYAASCGSMDQNLVPPDTTLTLTSSSNPSFVGRSLQFSAVVTARVGTPSGVVSFTDATTGALLGSATLDANGRAVSPPILLGFGVHAIQATYAPSTGSLYSSSTAALRQIVVVIP